MPTGRAILDLTLIVGAAVGAALVAAIARAPTAEGARPGGAARRVLGHPWTGFVGVCLLLFANQILFNVYVRVAHHGDVGFVARYLPRGWFALAPDAPPVAWLAARLSPAGAEVLAGSVLRVNAFLELPFTLLAYLAAARLYGAPLYRALVRLAPAAAVSFSITFCVVEWALRNPWTIDDLVIRAVSCAVFVGVYAWLSRRGAGAILPPPGAPRFAALLLALVGTALLGVVVLAMYDLTLLYNLGHFTRHGVGAVLVAAATAVTLVFAALGALEARAPSTSRGGGASLLFASVLHTFLALFFVPSLPIRYRMSSPASHLTALALIALAAIAGSVAGLRALRARGLSTASAALSVALGLAAGAALAALVRFPSTWREVWLLGKAALLLVPAWLVAAAVDAALAPRLSGRGPRV